MKPHSAVPPKLPLPCRSVLKFHRPWRKIHVLWALLFSALLLRVGMTEKMRAGL